MSYDILLAFQRPFPPLCLWYSMSSTAMPAFFSNSCNVHSGGENKVFRPHYKIFSSPIRWHLGNMQPPSLGLMLFMCHQVTCARSRNISVDCTAECMNLKRKAVLYYTESPSTPSLTPNYSMILLTTTLTTHTFSWQEHLAKICLLSEYPILKVILFSSWLVLLNWVIWTDVITGLFWRCHLPHKVNHQVYNGEWEQPYLWPKWWVRVSWIVLRSCFHPGLRPYTPSCQWLSELSSPCCSQVYVTTCRGDEVRDADIRLNNLYWLWPSKEKTEKKKHPVLSCHTTKLLPL